MASSLEQHERFDEALASALQTCEINYSLKDKQKDILYYLICTTEQSSSPRHAFVLLPTGYGKSDVFGLYGQIKNIMSKEKTKVVVISPLRSLMLEQVKKWKARNVRAFALLKQKEMSPKDIKGQLNFNK
jgi:superfamily II DNA helicase RecQ